MHTYVRLTVVRGIRPGAEYVFDDHTVCTVGRSEDCSLQMPNDLIHMDVSRHHCVLDIDPPHARVRDLGSRNGTYVNGVLIGQRPRGSAPEKAATTDQPEHQLHAGDELQIGATVLRVTIAEEDTPAEKADEAPGTDALLVN
jgi:pSer/pThr/pTyr-binding forkhead associated (FHA) protein